MKRAGNKDQASAIIRTRYYSGTYLASGAGKRASCTASRRNAALIVGMKIFGRRNFSLKEMSGEPDAFRADGVLTQDHAKESAHD